MKETTILAIDPGNLLSAYVVVKFPQFNLCKFGKIENEILLENIPELLKMWNVDYTAIEMIASYGMAVGKAVFDTCLWVGRFDQKFIEEGRKPELIYRAQEKICLCGSMKAKDSNIRTALIDRYAKKDFKTGKGTKKEPDTFYGVSADVWQAIAVAVTYYESIGCDL